MKFLPFDQDRHNLEVARAIRQLQRATDKADRPTTEEIIDFCVVGDMEVATSNPCRVRTGGQIVAVNFDSDDVGTGDTEFDVWVAGAAVGSTVTVPDTTEHDSYYIGDVRVPAGTWMQIDLTQAGMHPGAVIQVVMKG